MKIWNENYQVIPETDKQQWEELKKKEIVQYLGTLPVTKSLYREYPKSVRHHLSLFPNNFLDAVDLSKSKEELKRILTDFEQLLNDRNTTERNILNFIKENQTYFIIGSILKDNYSFGHHSLFIFPEFSLPPNYCVDYLLVGQNSNGYHFVFIELENPYQNITLQDGSFGNTIRKGINQINDWKIWIEANFSHLRLVFEGYKNDTETLPKEFNVFDNTRIHFVVVAGRRTDYDDKTYRLRREYQQDSKISVIHYDNLLDYANKTIGTQTY
jgi:hypothetical protein